MRILVLTALIVLSPVGAFAQTDSTSAELQALHAQWFKAFDAGDGQAMDQMEVPSLVLVMPNGMPYRGMRFSVGSRLFGTIELEVHHQLTGQRLQRTTQSFHRHCGRNIEPCARAEEELA